MSRLPIADDFEALAAATVLERGPAPIKASKGRTRILRTETGRVVTLGQVLESVALRVDVEIIVVEGRPTTIRCVDCGILVAVTKAGPVPSRCKVHGLIHRKRIYNATHPEQSKANRNKHRKKNPAKEKDRKARQKAKKRAAKAPTS